MIDKKELIKKYRDIVARGKNAYSSSASYALEVRGTDDAEFLRRRRNIEDHQSMLTIAFSLSIKDLEVLLDYMEEEDGR